jgi:hypothetical protein
LVEGVGGSLALLTLGCGSTLVTSSNGCFISLACRFELRADEVGNDTNVKSRALAEVCLVGRSKGRLLSSIKIVGEDDRWVGAVTEIKAVVLSDLGDLSGSEQLKVGSSKAGIFLSVAVSNTDIKLARVGSVGAGIVLDGARSLDGGALVQEGRAQDVKWSISVSVEVNSWCGAAKITIEALDIDNTTGTSIVVRGSVVLGISFISIGLISISLISTSFISISLISIGLVSIGLISRGNIVTSYECVDLGNTSIKNNEVLSEDAANNVIGIIAGVTSASWVTDL